MNKEKICQRLKPSNAPADEEKIGEKLKQAPTTSISESNPFLSASGSEEPSLSGDSFPGGGA
jgi:hypothetical protein